MRFEMEGTIWESPSQMKGHMFPKLSSSFSFNTYLSHLGQRSGSRGEGRQSKVGQARLKFINLTEKEQHAYTEFSNMEYV